MPQNILKGKPLSLAFLASNQQENFLKNEELYAEDLENQKNLVRIWRQVWSENTPSEMTAIKENLNSILELSSEAISHESWDMKITGNKCLIKLLNKINSTELFTPQVDQKIEEILLTTIKKPFYKGKKFALQALLVLNQTRKTANLDQLKLICSQLQSTAADADHIKFVKGLVLGQILPQFYKDFSTELKNEIYKFGKGIEDVTEYMDRMNF